jgi:hypothetical protein
MSANFAAQGGEGQIKELVFYSNYNEPVDVAAACVELNYYESILDNSVRCSATFADTGYRKDNENGMAVFEKDDINMTSGEEVDIKIQDGYGTELKFAKDNQLRISGDPSASSEDVNKVVFSVDMYSKECIDNVNASNYVYGRYDGKITDSVTAILRGCLKTPKNIIVDPGFNTYSFLGHSEKSFYLCTLLAKKCVPNIKNAFGNLAGYLFYETYEGFQFRSIDMLFMQQPKRKLIYNQLIGEIPPGYDGKILEYSFIGTVNLDSVIRSGAMTRARQQRFNSRTKGYDENSYDSESTYFEDNNGGKERPVIAKGTKIQESVTRQYSGRSADDGICPPGLKLSEQIPKARKPNFDMNEIVRQSTMRYNQLFSHKMSIAIPGDFSLRAGDLIYCDFPEVSGKTSRVVSQKVGGIYMIADVCHRLTKNSCYTRLNLVRDSIYRKPFK